MLFLETSLTRSSNLLSYFLFFIFCYYITRATVSPALNIFLSPLQVLLTSSLKVFQISANTLLKALQVFTNIFLVSFSASSNHVVPKSITYFGFYLQQQYPNQPQVPKSTSVIYSTTQATLKLSNLKQQKSFFQFINRTGEFQT